LSLVAQLMALVAHSSISWCKKVPQGKERRRNSFASLYSCWGKSKVGRAVLLY